MKKVYLIYYEKKEGCYDPAIDYGTMVATALETRETADKVVEKLTVEYPEWDFLIEELSVVDDSSKFEVEFYG